MSLSGTLKFLLDHPLTKHRPIQTLWRFGAWQLSSRIFPEPRVIPWIKNTKLWIKRGWTGITGNYYTGLHEFSDMAFLLHLLRPGDVFADVGANMGTYSILASGVCGSRTYSFEPIAFTFQRLMANIKLNGLQDRCFAAQTAVGNQEGQIKFTDQEDTTNHVVTDEETNFTIVPINLLDNLVADTPVLIKIDVEGFETEVINGATKHLNNPKLKAIIIELNGSGGRYGYSEEAIHQRLINLGFEPKQYDPFTRELTTITQLGNHNTIYCRDVAWINERLRTTNGFNVQGLNI